MAFLGQEEQLREFQDRFRLLYTIFFIMIGSILARLVFLQVLSGETMRRYSEENRIKRITIPAPRGMIFDRNNVLLIDNRPNFDLEITPQYLKGSGQQEQVIAHLSELISLPKKEIEESLRKAKGQPEFMPVKIKTDLSRDEVAAIETWRMDMPGVAVETEIQRTGVFGDIAAHLLGYISKVSQDEVPKLKGLGYEQGDSIGKFGIERELESHLKGRRGEEILEVNALGRRIQSNRVPNRVLGASEEVPAEPGNNLILTLDQDLQLAAVKAFGPKVGGLVAMDPHTGEILAMVSRPAFDPTRFSRGIAPDLWNQLMKDENLPLRDKTIQDHYPPGSAFKIVTAIAGLEEKLINRNTRFSCAGQMRVGNKIYHCHKKGGHGDLNVVQALEQSCNVFFYRLAQKFDSVDTLSKWAFRLGLGKKTAIALAREATGLIPTEAWKKENFGQEWTAGETLSVAIGQSFVLVTALQLANMATAVANGGTLFYPYFVKRIESPEGQPIESFSPNPRSHVDISQDTLDIVREGLWNVVNGTHGTAYYYRLPGMDMAGKTGTAQVSSIAAAKIYQRCENLPYLQRRHALFVGFAPKDDPKIVVSTIVEHGCHGSTGAASVAREVVKAYLLKYYPEKFGESALTPAPKTPATPEIQDE